MVLGAAVEKAERWPHLLVCAQTEGMGSQADT